MCLYNFAKAVFYITGGLAVLWFLTWQFFVGDDPTCQRFISANEKEYILAHRKLPVSGIGQKRPPYLKILLTPTIWVLSVCDFASAFGLYMIIIEGPNFIDNVLHKDILEVCTCTSLLLVELHNLYPKLT